MTQIMFDLDYVDRFLEKFGGPSPIPLIVGVWPVRSHQLALRLHNEVPGIVVPDHVQDALLRAGPNAPEVGAELTRGLIERARAEQYAGRLRRRAVPPPARRDRLSRRLTQTDR